MNKEIFLEDLETYQETSCFTEENALNFASSKKIIKELICSLPEYLINESFLYAVTPYGDVILIWEYKYVCFKLSITPSRRNLFKIIGGKRMFPEGIIRYQYKRNANKKNVIKKIISTYERFISIEEDPYVVPIGIFD